MFFVYALAHHTGNMTRPAASLVHSQLWLWGVLGLSSAWGLKRLALALRHLVGFQMARLFMLGCQSPLGSFLSLFYSFLVIRVHYQFILVFSHDHPLELRTVGNSDELLPMDKEVHTHLDGLLCPWDCLLCCALL